VKIVLVVALFGSLASSALSEDDNAPFTLAVVSSRSTAEERSIASAAKRAETFYVVLTNTSGQAQPVWQTSCSWGFWTVSFDITLPDGKHVHTSRNHEQAFTKNTPATFLVLPGQQQIYPIQLDSTWDNLPQFPQAGTTRITLKAIYQVGSTPEAVQENVWVGRLESPIYDFMLAHW